MLNCMRSWWPASSMSLQHRLLGAVLSPLASDQAIAEMTLPQKVAGIVDSFLVLKDEKALLASSRPLSPPILGPACMRYQLVIWPAAAVARERSIYWRCAPHMHAQETTLARAHTRAHLTTQHASRALALLCRASTVAVARVLHAS